MNRSHTSSGFVVSVELMLIALILGLGLIAGWVKFRDQSLAEIQDAVAAVDAYILGSGTTWQIGGTRWIQGGTVIAPGSGGAVSETWGDDPNPANWTTPAPAAVETAPGSHVYRNIDGFLVYGSPSAE